jgi:hypothetical protein
MKKMIKILFKTTYESDASESLSLGAALPVTFNRLYFSIKSIKYEFFLAFRMNGNFKSSFADGR